MAAASCTFVLPRCSACPASLSSSRSSVNGAGLGATTCVAGNAPVSKAISIRCSQKEDAVSEESVTRRSALALLAGLAAVGSRVSPAAAAYGEAANVFGSPRKDTGFVSYSGAGFSFLLPSKWNPSKEVEFPGQVLRYEDNFDPVTNLSVSILPSDKKSIKDYGPPEAFLKAVSYLLGKQSYKGQTVSEGGFDPNVVASASVFKAEEEVVKGKPYYYISVLTRTGDGTEGGRHQLIVGTVNDGKLYIFKAQAGDKRWFKGTQKYVEGAVNSFTVA